MGVIASFTQKREEREGFRLGGTTRTSRESARGGIAWAILDEMVQQYG